VIEACRKADCIDVLIGQLRKGMATTAIAEVEAGFPNLGFHKTLLPLTQDYGSLTIVGGLKVALGIYKL
jgi:hypothetical protein